MMRLRGVGQCPKNIQVTESINNYISDARDIIYYRTNYFDTHI